MSICFNSKSNVFLLNTPNSTYIIRLFENKYLLHGGWVNKLSSWSDNCVMPMIDRAFAPVPVSLHDRYDFSLDVQQQEFPVSGHGDFRNSAIEVISADGTNCCDLYYVTHRIIKGKPALPDLPATYVQTEDQADTLQIDLRDEVSGLEVTLSYTVFNTCDVITRHVTVRNTTSKNDLYKNKPLTITKLMSASIDFMGSRYKMLQLSGAHARERHTIIRELVPGSQKVESKRCASSHQQNPFIALLDYDTNEDSGNAYGFNFVYSGNFSAEVEVDQFNMSRVQMGINPYNFAWTLQSGESFTAPEVVMVFSNKGLGQLSRTYHDLYRDNLCRGNWKKKERPIVINNWEATYFDFNPQKLFKLADVAAAEGMELFVLDDGWFGKRNDDRTSLGDWFEFKSKLPGGIKEIADGIHQRGMKFGLWFEPEMISDESELYKKHPDWALRIKDRESSYGRHQRVLDLSRDDVVDYLIEVINGYLDTGLIDYIKWDFNRSPTEVSSSVLESNQQLSVSHRYYLGLYRLLEEVTQKHPDVLFESCSGGGGRFDPAMFYYMSQCWTSDNTDALSRVAIQMGTSIAYPASGMSCHVSAVPNHQSGRITSLTQRGNCAMAGTFGYELDLTKLPQNELDDIKQQVALYKTIRNTVQYGDLYRHEAPWTSKSQAETGLYSAWSIVSKDKRQAVFTVVWTYHEANPEYTLIKLRGLDKDSKYSVTGPSVVVKENLVITGEELMNVGLYLGPHPLLQGSLQLILQKL